MRKYASYSIFFILGALLCLTAVVALSANWSQSAHPYEKVYLLFKNNKSANTLCDIWSASDIGKRVLLGKPDGLTGHLNRCEFMVYAVKSADSILVQKRPANPFDLTAWLNKAPYKEMPLSMFEGYCFEKEYSRTDTEALPPYCRRLKEVEVAEFTALGKND